MKNTLSRAVTYFAYPLLLGLTVLTIHLAVSGQWDLQRTLLIYSLGLVFTLIVLERAFPLARAWGMTRMSFFRDLKYLAASGLTIALVRWSFGALALALSARFRGPLSDLPLWAAVPIFLLVFELAQYGYHRLSHEGPGRLGTFLWKVHAAHHMPDRVYVVMHAVFHPLNALLSAVLLQAVLLLLGLSPPAVFAAMLLIDLQALISHFNVDIRAGVFNYVFAGTELHRYHHSASVAEARNFGVVLTVWDLVFGTFHYRPGQVPARLGLDGSGEYPDSRDFGKVLALPFGRTGTGREQRNGAPAP